MGNLLIFNKAEVPLQIRFIACLSYGRVGIIVTSIGDDGYLKFDFVGGVDRRVVLGKRVISAKSGPSVIGIKRFIFRRRKSETRSRSEGTDGGYRGVHQMGSGKLCFSGRYRYIRSLCHVFGNGYIKAKALDGPNRCAVLLRLLMMRFRWTHGFAFTCRKSRVPGSRRGRIPSSSGISLVIEGTTAADMPSQKGADKVLLARKRSGHPVYDNAQFYDRQMNARLSEIADRNGMKWQTKTAVAAEGRPAYRKADTGVK